MDHDSIYREIIDMLPDIDARIDRQAIQLDDTPLKAHGLTSLTTIHLISLIEDRFGFAVSDTDAFTATSMRRLVELVSRRLHAAQDAAS